MSKKKKFGGFLAGALLGAGAGLLFAPKSGEETRKELKAKLDEMVDQAKKIDIDEVKKEFDAKVKEIKEGIEDLDKEKVMDFAKAKGAELKVKAEDLVALAKEKGTPALKKTAEEVLNNVIKVSKDALKKMEK